MNQGDQSLQRVLNLAVEAADAGIWRWSMVTGETIWSHRNFELMGYEPGKCEPSYENWLKAVHPDDRAMAEKAVAQALASKEKLKLTYRTNSPKGKTRWLSDLGEVTLGEDGEPNGMVGIQLDVSVRKEYEKELKRLNRALEEKVRVKSADLEAREKNYRKLIENLHAGVLVHDKDTRVELCNAVACEYLGVKQDQVMGKKADADLWQFVELNGDQLVVASHPVSSVIAHGKPIKNRVFGIKSAVTHELSWFLLNAFPELDAQQQLKSVVVTFLNITDLKRAEEKLRYEALHDSLTGLPNRSLLMDRIKRALSRYHSYHEYQFALLFIDLDRFKVINDSLGHLFGDRLLIKIAKRLHTCIRDVDTICRVGGDEFVVLLDNISGVNDAIAMAQSIQETLRGEISLDDHAIVVSASIGIALSRPSYKKPDEMIRDGDNAMFRAKSEGRARYALFDREMHQEAVRILELERNMRLAIEREDFKIHFQPVIDLERACLKGLEALVRWETDAGDPISPGEFIPLAEETGLIFSLSEWIIEHACLWVQPLLEKLPSDSPFRLAINLSAGQFQEVGFLENIDACLARCGFNPRFLTFEVTERLFMDHDPGVMATLEGLKARHIQISIDDFGTGYSSLAYLRRFPVDTLKIDKSFVDNLSESKEDRSIVDTVISLACGLGMSVVAEGVETQAQLDVLRQLGCPAVQGFLFSKAVPFARAERLLEAWCKPGSLVGRWGIGPN